MKLFSLVLSVITFITALYFFIIKVPEVNTFDEVIYISLLAILMVISIIGVIINWGIIRKRRASVVLFVTNTLSKPKK